VGRELLDCGSDDREVRLALTREGGGEGDENRVGFGDGLHVERRLQAAGVDEFLERNRRDVADVALPTVDAVDDLGFDVAHKDVPSRLGEDLSER
jgi:hypothetical protein